MQSIYMSSASEKRKRNIEIAKESDVGLLRTSMLSPSKKKLTQTMQIEE
jgi:hypothetical protein